SAHERRTGGAAATLGAGDATGGTACTEPAALGAATAGGATADGLVAGTASTLVPPPRSGVTTIVCACSAACARRPIHPTASAIRRSRVRRSRSGRACAAVDRDHPAAVAVRIDLRELGAEQQDLRRVVDPQQEYHEGAGRPV